MEKRLFLFKEGNEAREKLELDELLSAFEKKYDISGLFALSTEEDSRNPIRQEAKRDLIPIAKLLGGDRSVARAKFLEQQARYERLSNAVGILHYNKLPDGTGFDINGAKIRHNSNS